MTLKLNNNNKEKKLALQLVSCSSTALGLTVERDDIQQHGALPPVGGPLQLGRGEDPDCGGWVLQSGQQLVLAQRSVLPWTIVRHVPAETTHMQQRLSFSSCPPVSSDVEINWILRERIKKTLSESCFFFFYNSIMISRKHCCIYCKCSCVYFTVNKAQKNHLYIKKCFTQFENNLNA